MNKSLKFWIIEASPVVKRIFFWNDILYNIFNVLPAVLALDRKVNVVVVALYLFMVIELGFGLVSPEAVGLYVVGLVPFLFSAQYDYDFEDFMRRSRWLLVIFVLYGLYQKFAGYTSFEMGWILSGRAKVGEAGLFLAGDIRPFSVFAGIPEFSVIVALWMFYEFAYLKRYLVAFLLLVFLVSMGSRGVLVGAFVAMSVLYFGRNWKRSTRLITVVGSVIGIYALLISLAAILWQYEGSGFRMLVYGTFNARVEILMDFFQNISWSSLYTGVGRGHRVFDNIYISLTNDFGFIGVLALFFLFWRLARDTKSEFMIYMMIAYGCFSDILHSFFLMYALAMTVYSRESAPAIASEENLPDPVAAPI